MPRRQVSVVAATHSDAAKLLKVGTELLIGQLPDAPNKHLLGLLATALVLGHRRLGLHLAAVNVVLAVLRGWGGRAGRSEAGARLPSSLLAARGWAGWAQHELQIGQHSLPGRPAQRTHLQR